MNWHLRLSKDEPKKSGQYVCTCIYQESHRFGTYSKYIRVMEYDAERGYWHDIGNKSGISHTILAWKEESVCSQKINEDEYMELMR